MSQISFKEALQQATFTHNRALSSEVDQIDIGNVFHDAAAGLLRRTLNDPARRSFSRAVLIGSDRKVHISEDFFVSGQEPRPNLGIRSQDTRISREQQQDKFIGAYLKSAFGQIPFQLQDIFKILVPDNDPYARTALFSASSTDLTLMFRSQDTPVLDGLSLGEKEDVVLSAADNVISRFGLNRSKSAEFINQTVNSMTEKGHLRVFSCASNEQIARLKR